MIFQNKIYELRKEKNMSQENLANKLSVSRQAVAKWENGESFPDINNLIMISNLFNISIDRLVKNDNCITNMTMDNFDQNELIEFLITAKKNTYASNNNQDNTSYRPNSHDLIYENDKYKYHDSYFGGENFIGEEILYKNNIPIWGMNYCGIELNENFSSKFLKEALSNVSIDKPFRGPDIYQDGDYLYICKHNGDFNRFQGIEEIYFHKEKIYECTFHGGIIN